jgi:hypothetical protein
VRARGAPEVGVAGQAAGRVERGRAEAAITHLDGVPLVGPEPLGRDDRVLELQVAQRDHAHETAQRRAQVLEQVIGGMVAPFHDPVVTGPVRDLLVQRRPAGRVRGQVEHLEALTVGHRVAARHGEQLARAGVARRCVRLAQHSRPAQRGRPHLDLRQQPAADPPAAQVDGDVDLGVDHVEVVLERSAHRGDADHLVAVEGRHQRPRAVGVLLGQRLAAELPGWVVVEEAVRRRGSPRVPPAPELMLVPDVDLTHLDGGHLETLGSPRPQGRTLIPLRSCPSTPTACRGPSSWQ